MLKQESIFSSETDVAESLQGALSELTRLRENQKYLKDENTWLREQIKELQRGQFGSKSERWESAEQMRFLNEAEMESKNPDALSDEEIPVAAHTKKRGHRKPLPENLPREIVKIELPVCEQVDEVGTPLKVIGWDISEKLKYEPAKMSVVEYHRAKYGADSGDYEKTAAPVPSIIPKGIATPELLAAIVVGKYADGLPLYRMEEIFSRSGVELSRGTMARWMVQVAKYCQPIWNVLSDQLLASFYVACDETTVRVLKENGKPVEGKSWMWVRSTPRDEKKIVLFDYSRSRSGAVAKDLFLDYEGYLQCDGLASYNALESESIIRIGCNMHARRRFESAVVNGASSGKSLGEKGLEFYKKIYDLEEEIRGKPPDERYRVRQEEATPIWTELREWVDKNQSKVPKKSKVGMAFQYFTSEYEYLIGYLKDGRLEPDNGFTERAIRKFAIGRNNWMFSDTDGGANASSVLYSLVVTAKSNGIDPYWALVKLFTELPLAQGIEDFERLAGIILASEKSA